MSTTNGTTNDPNDPRLTHGTDDEPTEMADVYLVLSKKERKARYIRPLRRSYVHETCGNSTTVCEAIAETYARDPKFYGVTFCVSCQMHRLVGPSGEFVWFDGSKVGS